MPTPRTELQALRNLISEAELIVSADIPGGKARVLELLHSALGLTDDLLGQAKLAPAVMLGSKGGSTTSQRFGTEHYRKMAAARKVRGGGRPRKQP